MLKAVRFDPEEHAELLKYIENYRDKKNKPNHSEAIRFLMMKGLENIDTVSKPTQQNIDIEAIKSELFNQLMAQFNQMNIQPKIDDKPIKSDESDNTGLQQKPQQPSIPKPSVPKSANTNPLLANILGNANR